MPDIKIPVSHTLSLLHESTKSNENRRMYAIMSGDRQLVKLMNDGNSQKIEEFLT